jgi:hypothetical protein
MMDAVLESIARRVNWYTAPAAVLLNIDVFLAQVMARASTEDLVIVQQRFSTDAFRRALINAPPGLFTKRAWAYWALVLLDDPDRPMPERFPGANQFDWRRAT